MFMNDIVNSTGATYRNSGYRFVKKFIRRIEAAGRAVLPCARISTPLFG
jgi:hypothetical protein